MLPQAKLLEMSNKIAAMYGGATVNDDGSVTAVNATITPKDMDIAFLADWISRAGVSPFLYTFQTYEIVLQKPTLGHEGLTSSDPEPQIAVSAPANEDGSQPEFFQLFNYDLTVKTPWVTATDIAARRM